MDTIRRKGGENPGLKSWIPLDHLDKTPSLSEDHRINRALFPGDPAYIQNIQRYMGEWKAYWATYIPEMMSTKAGFGAAISSQQSISHCPKHQQPG